jgi:glycosyltransferase involved in cell wall biosynthesis
MNNISFVVPAYNCSATIQESINSIFAGNFCTGDEVIVVDDCSTDNTLGVLESFARNKTTIRIFTHTANRGGGAARNTAVENATNPLIFCLDSDNILEPYSIPRLKRYLLAEHADIAAFQELRYFRDDISQLTHKWIFRPGKVSLADCLSGGIVPISSGNYLYTKHSWNAAGKYPEFAHALDAWGFGLRQVATGSKMLVLENSGYFHRHGHESYWVREDRKGQNSLIALKLLSPFVDQLDDASVAYLTAEATKFTWFENMEANPIRTKWASSGKQGRIERVQSCSPETQPSWVRSLPFLLKRFTHTVASFRN